MSTQSKLKLLVDTGHKQIWVFVHGYKAIENKKEYKELVENILKCNRPKGRIYLYFWKSGDWKEQKVALLGHAIIWGNRLRKIKTITSFLAPELIAAEVGAHALYEGVKFNVMKNRAEEYGRDFKRRISRLKYSKEYKINLVGHSLGARLIQYSLEHSDWTNLRLRDVYFFGSAGDIEDQNYWDKLVKNIRGKIINYYSMDDWILLGSMFNMNLKVGRNIIKDWSEKIENHKTKLGHTDYWKNLYKFLK